MREYKFRGKNAEGEWIYGSLIIGNYERSDGKQFDVAFITEGLPCMEQPNNMWTTRMRRVEPRTVGQFTECTDKSGKEIYDGDVVECVSWNEYFSDGNGKPLEPFRRKMHIEMRHGAFKMVEPMPEPMKDNEWDIIFNGDIEIIGNIHDNPELLKI